MIDPEILEETKRRLKAKGYCLVCGNSGKVRLNMSLGDCIPIFQEFSCFECKPDEYLKERKADDQHTYEVVKAGTNVVFSNGQLKEKQS